MEALTSLLGRDAARVRLLWLGRTTCARPITENGPLYCECGPCESFKELRGLNLVSGLSLRVCFFKDGVSNLNIFELCP